jgi:hypothetical protein
VSGPDVSFPVGFGGQGPTVPVTSVVPAPPLVQGASASSFAAGAGGSAGVDALDFLTPLITDARKKPGDPPADA